MSDTYHIWTVQMAKWRLVAEANIEHLDTTAKSGIKAFAPDFNDVMNYKANKLSEEMYTDIYVRRMRNSRINHPGEWKKLLKHKRVAVSCYCPAGQFCHRHLFVKDLKAYYEGLGHIVVLHGEITTTVPKVPTPTPIERPAQERLEFHGKEDLLSNWNRRGYTVKGIYFEHGEQFMMYCKAKLMGDEEMAIKILAEKDPGECKRLGRLVSPFNEPLWDEKAPKIMFHGCLQKAREHQDVADYLLANKGKLIVEASKSDRIWGAGLAKGDPRLLNDPATWPGLNKLGNVWTRVRTVLEDEIVF